MPKPINNRRAGHSYERDLRTRYRALGFSDCETSRFASKMMDDAGVDLVNTGPLSIQAKRTKTQPNFRAVLDRMPQDSNHNVVYHKLPRCGEVVVMRVEDFEEIVGLLVKEGLWKP